MLLRRALLGLVAIVLLGAATVAGVRLLHVDEALPGTEIAGASVAGASNTDIRRRLRALAAEDAPIRITAGGEVLRRRPSSMGYSVDVEATVRAALRQGREGVLGGSLATLAGVVRGQPVAIAARIDDARLDDAARQVAAEVERPSYPGPLEIDPASGAVAVDAPVAGRQVDRRELNPDRA